MEKWLILFLNVLLISLCNGQATVQKLSLCDCTSRKVQDSLTEKFLENGAFKLPHMFNNPRWSLYCDSVIAICPNIAYAYQQKAIPFIKYGEFGKAFALENKAVELEPEVYTAYRGFLKCIFTKDYDGAILDFLKAQELSPNNYEMDHTYFFWLAVSYMESGNFTEAENNFRQDIFIQTNGDSTKTPHFNTLFYYGVFYYEMKNYSLAKEYLLKCLSQYKEHTDANYYLAMVYKAEKNYDLEKKYLLIAKYAFEKGHGISEDNVFYANYPHQIRLYEVEQALNDKR